MKAERETIESQKKRLTPITEELALSKSKIVELEGDFLREE